MLLGWLRLGGVGLKPWRLTGAMVRARVLSWLRWEVAGSDSMRFSRVFWRTAARRGARSEGVAMGGHVRVSCHGHCHISSGLQALVALAWAMDGAGAMQSAAARRLAALLQHDEEQVQQQKQAAVEAELDCVPDDQDVCDGHAFGAVESQ